MVEVIASPAPRLRMQNVRKRFGATIALAGVDLEVRAGEVLALETLGRSDIRPDMPVSRLSVAQQQLVEIGRAIAVGCRVLVLDEPTSSLPRRDIARLFDLVHRLKGQDHAIVYISHFLEEV